MLVIVEMHRLVVADRLQRMVLPLLEQGEIGLDRDTLRDRRRLDFQAGFFVPVKLDVVPVHEDCDGVVLLVTMLLNRFYLFHDQAPKPQHSFGWHGRRRGLRSSPRSEKR